MATFDERSIVISDVDGNNAAVTPAGALQIDGSAVTQPISAVALPLPAGAATEATLLTVESDTASIASSTNAIDTSTSSLDTKFDATLSMLLNTLGQKTMLGSAPVVIASNQSAIPVSGTVDVVDPSVGEIGTGAPLFSTQIGGPDSDGNLDAPRVLTSGPGAGDPGLVVRNVPSGTQDTNLVKINGSTVVTQAAGEQLVGVEGRAANGAAVTGNPVLVGAEDAAGNVQRLRTAILPPVDSTPGQVVRQVVSQTGTTTSVASSATNVTLLAANTARLGARITNDSTKKLYVKCGATASTTSYTKLLGAGEDWFVDAGYTGIIDGIWSAVNGSARITEYI